MKCPKCGEEMKEIQTPSISVKEVMEQGKMFPIKLICYLVHIYGCDKCPVKATYAETEEYKICQCKLTLDAENKELKPE